jgi:hypothetical protein
MSIDGVAPKLESTRRYTQEGQGQGVSALSLRATAMWPVIGDSVLRLSATLALVGVVAGHGAVVRPPARNAIDKDLAPVRVRVCHNACQAVLLNCCRPRFPLQWNGKVPCTSAGNCPSVETATGWCPVPGTDGKVSGQNGQACFWFSNG